MGSEWVDLAGSEVAESAEAGQMTSWEIRRKRVSVRKRVSGVDEGERGG
jgi:hypothetical protein